MSQENVKVVRAQFEAWNKGDMDAYRELYDPDVMWRAAEGWPEPGPFVGREAVTRLSSNSVTPGTPTPWNRSATSSTPRTGLS
jgi:ketosteroid isomerase-like protein